MGRESARHHYPDGPPSLAASAPRVLGGWGGEDSRTANGKWLCMFIAPGRATARALLVAPVILRLSAVEAMAGLVWLSPELRRLETEEHAMERSLRTLPAVPAPHFTERLDWHSDYPTSQGTIE